MTNSSELVNTLWETNLEAENPPFLSGLPVKHGVFLASRFVNQSVYCWSFLVVINDCQPSLPTLDQHHLSDGWGLVVDINPQL